MMLDCCSLHRGINVHRSLHHSFKGERVSNYGTGPKKPNGRSSGASCSPPFDTATPSVRKYEVDY